MQTKLGNFMVGFRIPNMGIGITFEIMETEHVEVGMVRFFFQLYYIYISSCFGLTHT